LFEVKKEKKEVSVMFIVRKFLVRKHERALLFKNGDFVRFLTPGAHYELDPLKRLSVQLFDIAAPLFEHRLADFFVKEYAADVARLFTVIEMRSRSFTRAAASRA
jgi:hypothetical protein